MSDSDTKQEIQRAVEADAREVERLYSTKPIHVRMGGREYVIPVNHFTTKGRDEPERGDSKALGFVLFLPAYGGYTKENWRDPFDRRLIKVLQVNAVDKDAMIPYAGGGLVRVEPANYGEPRAQFKNHKASLEEKPTYKLYGLEGYHWKKRQIDGITWVGNRSNGEFFFFMSSLSPGQPIKPGVTNPLCKIQYYSTKEDLSISYFYSQDHIAKWLEIDDAIWATIHRWRAK